MTREELQNSYGIEVKDCYGELHDYIKWLEDKILSLPPADAKAEEILVKHGFFIMAHKDSNEEVRKVFIEPVLAAMQEFATLHAQRIADKMVSERLRKELISYEEHWNFVLRDNAEKVVDEYLKSRE